MTCKEFQNELPDLILSPTATPSPAALAHLRVCPPCTEELHSFGETFALLDTWTAPEPTPYFEPRLYARLREEQAAAPMGWWERMMTRLQLNTGRQLRPAMAGALAVLLAAGGGSFAGLMLHQEQAKPAASAAVNDLQILDRNAQTFEQLDQLQADEDSGSPDTQDAASPTS